MTVDTKAAYWDPEVQRERALKEAGRNAHGKFGEATPAFANKNEAMGHMINNHGKPPVDVQKQPLAALEAAHQQMHGTVETGQTAEGPITQQGYAPNADSVLP